MNTFNKLWGVVTPAEAEAKIAELRAVFGRKTPENLEEQAISLVGTDIYEKLISHTPRNNGKNHVRSCQPLSFVVCPCV